MRQQVKWFTVFVLFVVLCGLLGACQSTPEAPASTAPGISVEITDDSCPSVEIQAGQQVTWTNTGSQEHLVEATSTEDSSSEGSVQFSSSSLQPGDTLSVSFPDAGSYTYICSADGRLAGTITVQP